MTTAYIARTPLWCLGEEVVKLDIILIDYNCGESGAKLVNIRKWCMPILFDASISRMAFGKTCIRHESTGNQDNPFGSKKLEHIRLVMEARASHRLAEGINCSHIPAIETHVRPVYPELQEHAPAFLVG